MEDLKLAFETVIVGLLAIPWLLVLCHILIHFFTGSSLLDGVRRFIQADEKSFALIGTVIIGLAYCAGTILFPIADNLFNKNRQILGIHIESDESIRNATIVKLYFHNKYYTISEKDFPDLPDVQNKVAALKERGKQIDLHQEESISHEELDDLIHPIYNFQKYHSYNSAKGYEILKPLSSRIVVLRGAVLNGVCLLYSLIIFFIYTLLQLLYKLRFPAVRRVLVRSRNRLTRAVTTQTITILFLTILVWFLCWWGAWGVSKAEEEYDKHVVGIFYGSKAVSNK
ncbi:MAG TPA: hypothetical protein VGX92_03660 [Pyrinomonadaceae bacterium]|jgi:hypothetical protein|nr:hypothetical protein [Pyrinomonadaceae bacterium]